VLLPALFCPSLVLIDLTMQISGEESRELIGSLGGVRILVHLCSSSQAEVTCGLRNLNLLVCICCLEYWSCLIPVSLSACRVGRAQEVIDDALFSLHLLVTDDASIEDFVCLGGLQVNTLTGMKRIN